MNDLKITTLFLDIGGVLLSNAWDSKSREKAVLNFKLNREEFSERHHLAFDTYEEGKLTLSEYLKLTVFYETRQFSEDDFITFIYSQSVDHADTIGFFKKLKKEYQLKVIAVSNEGRELNANRVKEFKLNELFDAYVSSAFVHLRKPDAAIFRMALDISQTEPAHSVYIDDRLIFVQIAEHLGMNGLHYQGLEAAIIQLKAFGLTIDKN